ncbi:MAG: hypothetical protein Q4B85_06695 [Lachnospiraceae bacterium]|nr:hypothetical protein [Lachnospiraceae bacterium]
MVPITLFDSEFREIGPALVSCDIETGDSSAMNDMEIKSPVDAYGICILGTDAGGIIEYIDAVSGSVPEKRGYSWRGLLQMAVLQPPAGSDYLKISNMDLNRALEHVLGNVLGGLFVVPNEEYGVTVRSYQFDLYTDALTGLTELCRSVGARLHIHAEKSSNQKKILIVAEAKPIRTYEEEFAETSAMQLEFTKDGMGYNHMICMGKGELQNRLRVDLYLQQDGTFGSQQHYYGINERQYYYDDNNADTVEKLRADGLKKFTEICPSKILKVKRAPEELEVGDIVRGVYAAEGITVEAPISKIIYRVTGDVVTKEYGVKE